MDSYAEPNRIDCLFLKTKKKKKKKTCLFFFMNKHNPPESTSPPLDQQRRENRTAGRWAGAPHARFADPISLHTHQAPPGPERLPRAVSAPISARLPSQPVPTACPYHPPPHQSAQLNPTHGKRWVFRPHEKLTYPIFSSLSLIVKNQSKFFPNTPLLTKDTALDLVVKVWELYTSMEQNEPSYDALVYLGLNISYCTHGEGW